MTTSWTYTTGGTLAPDAPSYVERKADKDLLDGLLAGRFCYVLNSRQMGKSSLCVRTMGVLREAGWHTAFVDLTKLGGKNVTPEQWYVGIANEIGRALGLRGEFMAFWKENSEFSPIQRLFGAIREVALEKLDKPLAVFVDEIDATRSLSFSTDEFFAAIREGYNRRVQDPAFSRLTFCLLGVAVPSDLINSPTSTPFNIGERIYLQDFTLKEAMPLSRGLSRLGAEDLLQQIHYWTNGQPYLTQSLCAAVAADEAVRTPKDVDAMVSRDLFQPEARETNINLADVANRALHAGDLEEDPEKFRADLLSAYEKAWRGKPLPDDEANRVAALLKLSGIMRAEGNQLKVRNRIYQTVFGKTWIADNMPGQELRRQKRSFWKGVLRTALVGTAVVAVVAYFALAANAARRTAEAAKKELDYQLYVAKMNVMPLFEQEGNSIQMEQTLNETRASPYRGWEWGYWYKVLHDSDEEYIVDSRRRDPTPLTSFSTDGKQLLIHDKVLETAFHIDRKTRGLIGRYPLSKSETAMWAKTGWIAYEVLPKTVVRDLPSGKSLYSLDLSKSQYRTIFALSNAGALSIYEFESSGRGRNRLLDASTGQQIWAQDFTVPAWISGVSNDRSRALVQEFPLGLSKSQVSVIDLKSGTRIDQVEGSQQLSALSPSGRYVALTLDNAVTVRDVDRHRTIMSIPQPIKDNSGAVFGNNDSFLYIIHPNLNLDSFSVPDARKILTRKRCVLASPGTSSLLVSFNGSSVRVYDQDSSNPSKFSAVTSIGRDFDGHLILENGYTGRTVILSETDFKQIRTSTYDGANERLSSDGRLRISRSSVADSKVTIRLEESKKVLLKAEKVGFGGIYSASLANSFLVLSEDSKKLRYFDYGSQAPRWTVHFKEEVRPSISADGRRVLVRGDRLGLFDGNTGKQLESYGFEPGSRVDYNGYGFVNKTEDYWFSSGGVLKLFDGKRRNVIFSLENMGSYCSVEDVTPDGSRVLIVDGVLRMYDLKTGKRLCLFPGVLGGAGSCFTSDGKKLVTAYYGGQLQVVQSDDVDRAVRLQADNPLK